MAYDQRSLKEITEKYQNVGQDHDQLMLRLGSLRSKLKNDKAIEYLMQGAGRRLGTITRCIENIFRIFPIGQTELLAKDDLTDLGINLHAFFVNISGIFDNLGWVFAFEHDLVGKPKEMKLRRIDIGLFNPKTQSYLPKTLCTYLNSNRMRTWHSEYSKNYRDALAHRIPLYVAPSLLIGADLEKYNEFEVQLQNLNLTKDENLETYKKILEKQRQLGQASPFFAHSDGEKGRPVYLHAQVIADYATIEEIVIKFCEQF